MKKRILMWGLAAVVLTGALAGCAAGEKNGAGAKEPSAAADSAVKEPSERAETSGGAGAQEPVELLVAAAASLKNVFEEDLIPLYQSQNPDIVIRGAYDSSGKLQTQIEGGLEADLFVSAAKKQMDSLEDGGWLADGSRTDLLENKVVLIVPADSGADWDSFEDITQAEIIALGDPASVPAGQYAKEALTSLGIWEQIQDRVSLGTNVTEVLSQVAEAGAQAGIVYATDAAGRADSVRVVAEAPEGSLSEKVVYPAAVLKSSEAQDAALSFLEFLRSDEAGELFESRGFDAIGYEAGAGGN